MLLTKGQVEILSYKFGKVHSNSHELEEDCRKAVEDSNSGCSHRRAPRALGILVVHFVHFAFYLYLVLHLYVIKSDFFIFKKTNLHLKSGCSCNL